MAENTLEPKADGKLFYTIGEVAAMFNVNTSLIRFWDKEFEAISPRRNRKGNRLFTPTDVAYFHKIYHWVKEEGYTLQGAKDKLKEKPLAADTAEEELLQRLHRVRKFLTDLKESL
ncbi:MAG: MerR family transcriptional regulator [Bacteroidales bacterium]|nr:MerR family transcriptional regulator [Bacteroidales bacterium]MDE6112402.1 MerR family transcriptional regulator [Bacteroidales bacterium]